MAGSSSNCLLSPNVAQGCGAECRPAEQKIAQPAAVCPFPELSWPHHSRLQSERALRLWERRRCLGPRAHSSATLQSTSRPADQPTSVTTEQTCFLLCWLCGRSASVVVSANSLTVASREPGWSCGAGRPSQVWPAQRPAGPAR